MNKILVGKLVKSSFRVWDGWSFHVRMPEGVDPDQ